MDEGCSNLHIFSISELWMREGIDLSHSILVSILQWWPNNKGEKTNISADNVYFPRKSMKLPKWIWYSFILKEHCALCTDGCPYIFSTLLLLKYIYPPSCYYKQVLCLGFFAISFYFLKFSTITLFRNLSVVFFFAWKLMESQQISENILNFFFIQW